ncbi:D-ribose-binding periplasmic protein [Trifolium repens]|nr:D-ribose-binding periplasmic protein [Trifolium repens]
MGNCQAIDAATLVIQHPNGKTEKFYSSINANQVMKMNPGHCVALLISTTIYPNKNIEKSPKNNNSETKTNPVRLTRIKLLKPTDDLLLGHVYRLITTQEVMKGLREKKQAKMKQNKLESAHKHDLVKENLGLEMEKKSRRFDTQDNQATKPERGRTTRKTSSTNNAASVTAKTRFWQPSLQSISEVAS